MKFRLHVPYFNATATWCKHTLPFIPCSLGVCMYTCRFLENSPQYRWCLFLFYVGYLKLVWIFLIHGYAAHTNKTCISSQATGSKVQSLWLSKCHGEKHNCDESMFLGLLRVKSCELKQFKCYEVISLHSSQDSTFEYKDHWFCVVVSFIPSCPEFCSVRAHSFFLWRDFVRHSWYIGYFFNMVSEESSCLHCFCKHKVVHYGPEVLSLILECVESLSHCHVAWRKWKILMLKCHYDENHIFSIEAILKHKQEAYMRRKRLFTIFQNLCSRDIQGFKICKLAKWWPSFDQIWWKKISQPIWIRNVWFFAVRFY